MNHSFITFRFPGQGCSSRGGFPVGAAKIWLLQILSLLLVFRLTVMLRQRQDFAAIDALAVAQIGLVGLTFLVLASTNLTRWWSRVKGTSAAWWYVYGALGVLSGVWSRHPTFSLYRAGEMLVLSSALLLVISSFVKQRDAEWHALGLAGVAILFTLVGSWKLGGFHPLVFPNNTLGAMGAMLAAYCYGEWLVAEGRRHKIMLWGLLGGLYITFCSWSLASWWSFAFGVVIVGLLGRRRGPFVLLAVAMVLVSIAFGPEVLQELVLRDKTVEDVQTLHGRTRLWWVYFDAFLERPFVGYGYGVGARVLSVFHTTNTHNALFSIMLGGGIVALAIMVFMGIRLIAEMMGNRKKRLPGSNGIIAAMAAAGMNSMANGFIGETWTPASFVFMCFVALHLQSVISPGAPNLFHFNVRSGKRIDSAN